MTSAGGAAAGFDYLRIGLALAVLAWHSIWLSTGSAALDAALWSGPFRFLPAAIIPTFFALSGFLVAGSLARTRLHQFVVLRCLRLVPALAVEVTLSALVLGALVTTLPLRDYFGDPRLYAYLLNTIGMIHYALPGVFAGNPGGATVNAQLWTIPFELDCYLALILLAASGLLRRRRLVVGLVVATALALTARALAGNPLDPTTHVPGEALVLSFLAGVCLHLYRETVPYSGLLGAASGVTAVVLLGIPDAAYLAAFPVAYLTVWLGLMRPPKIPFGDLSYGVYLFHFPVEQTIMHLRPALGSWWLLTLLSLPVTAVLAWLSWTFVEGPIAARKRLVLTRLDAMYAFVARWHCPPPREPGRLWRDARP